MRQTSGEWIQITCLIGFFLAAPGIASAQEVIDILSERLNDPGDLPDRLRNLFRKADAIWLLPGPVLVSAQNLSILKEYSWSNRIPFYAPTAGFVQQGATASVSSRFREVGRAAGLAAQEVLSGEWTLETIYPEKAEVTINVKAAEKAGLEIPKGALQRADKVLP